MIELTHKQIEDMDPMKAARLLVSDDEEVRLIPSSFDEDLLAYTASEARLRAALNIPLGDNERYSDGAQAMLRTLCLHGVITELQRLEYHKLSRDAFN